MKLIQEAIKQPEELKTLTENSELEPEMAPQSEEEEDILNPIVSSSICAGLGALNLRKVMSRIN